MIRVASTPSDHRVRAKGQEEVPLINLKTQLLRRIFDTRSTLDVRIERDRIALTRRALDARIEARLRDGSVGSMFAGGGLGDLAARQAGSPPGGRLSSGSGTPSCTSRTSPRPPSTG